MERRPPHQEKAARRTLPRRGQIKAGIFASLFRCIVAPEAPARKEGGTNKDGSSSHHRGCKNKDGGSHRRVSPGG